MFNVLYEVSLWV